MNERRTPELADQVRAALGGDLKAQAGLAVAPREAWLRDVPALGAAAGVSPTVLIERGHAPV